MGSANDPASCRWGSRRRPRLCSLKMATMQSLYSTRRGQDPNPERQACNDPMISKISRRCDHEHLAKERGARGFRERGRLLTPPYSTLQYPPSTLLPQNMFSCSLLGPIAQALTPVKRILTLRRPQAQHFGSLTKVAAGRRGYLSELSLQSYT